MFRVAITGPESSGKTTLAKMLAEHYKVDYAEEFARDYLTARNGEYNQSDLDTIAKGQLESIQNLKRDKLLLTDTEMLVVKIWSEFRYHTCSPFIMDVYHDQQYDLYILCDVDIAYEEDPLRENPDDRSILFKLYESALKEKGGNYIVCSGDENERFSHAIVAIDNFM